MGGVSVEGGGGGGRKSVDSNINMVPMIDLLISVIAFLLMTAVWVQTGAVAAQQPKKSGAPTQNDAPPKPKLQVDITKDHYHIALTEGGGEPRDVQAGNDAIDKLRGLLQERHKAMPNIDEVWLHPETDMKFEDIVKVMDLVYEVWGEGKKSEETWSSKVTLRFV